MEQLNGLLIGRDLRQHKFAAALRIALRAMQSHARIQRAGDRKLFSGKAGQIWNIKLRRVELHQQQALVREGPVLQSRTRAQLDAATRRGFEIGILQAGPIRTDFYAGAQRLPGCPVDEKILRR